jgi:hypothetical protein
MFFESSLTLLAWWLLRTTSSDLRHKLKRFETPQENCTFADVGRGGGTYCDFDTIIGQNEVSGKVCRCLWRPLVQIYSVAGAGVIVMSRCQSSTNDNQIRPHQEESVDKQRGQRNVASHWNETGMATDWPQIYGGQVEARVVVFSVVEAVSSEQIAFRFNETMAVHVQSLVESGWYTPLRSGTRMLSSAIEHMAEYYPPFRNIRNCIQTYNK